MTLCRRQVGGRHTKSPFNNGGRISFQHSTAISPATYGMVIISSEAFWLRAVRQGSGTCGQESRELNTTLDEMKQLPGLNR